jgi:hypothetical protein
MNTVDEKWENFKRKVIPESANFNQLQDMQLAFYAGMLTLLLMQKEVLTGLSDDAGVALLESWHDEIQHYFKSL